MTKPPEWWSHIEDNQCQIKHGAGASFVIKPRLVDVPGAKPAHIIPDSPDGFRIVLTQCETNYETKAWNRNYMRWGSEIDSGIGKWATENEFNWLMERIYKFDTTVIEIRYSAIAHILEFTTNIPKICKQLLQVRTTHQKRHNRKVRQVIKQARHITG